MKTMMRQNSFSKTNEIPINNTNSEHKKHKAQALLSTSIGIIDL